MKLTLLKLKNIYNFNVSKQATNRFIITFLFITLQNCGDKCKNADVEKINITYKFTRLEPELFKAKDVISMSSVLKKHIAFTKGYLDIQKVEDLETASTQLLNLYQNPNLINFNSETQKSFKKIDSLQSELTSFFQHTKFYYPKFYVPEVNTIVTGFHFEKDLFVSDSLIVISLDYFLGKDAKFRPPYFNYFLERYEKPYLLPMIALGVSSKFNKVNMEDETMLSNMIFYGKALYFAKAMLPCSADSLVMMYSDQQMKDVNENVATIWAHFINEKLLFETNRHQIDKYVGETPKVNEIGDKCPGRIGRWLGWEIVKKYMEENPKLSLPQLMAENDAQKIFRLSKYKPKK